MTVNALVQPEVARPPEHNRIGLDYRAPMPRPKARGLVIDAHVHLLAARHGREFFQAAGHFGIDGFMTMTPLDEALSLARDWPGRLHFIAVPYWRQTGPRFMDEWLRCLEAFYNLGSRVAKFWCAPPAIGDRQWRLDSPAFRRLMREASDRGMAIMTHVGDPEVWYPTRYADTAKYGTRDEHYRMWENVLEEFAATPWLGAHLGGNPEDLPRIQRLLDRYPKLRLDCSATRWLLREISIRRDEAREFFIHNQDRILFGTDQVSGDQRGFDFLASRFWAHRKLWDTAYIGPAPIFDPDLPEDQQPTLRGLALPDECLQKLYHDNAVKFLADVGASMGG
jgi:hypothetical protein